MIDNVCGYFKNECSEFNKQPEHPIEYLGLIWKPMGHKNGYSYRTFINDFQLRMSGEKISFSQSFHKYYHGNNYSDFTFPELKQMIDEIDNILEGKFRHSVISNIEFGVNVTIDKPIEKQFSHHKSRPVYDMNAKNKVYGKKAAYGEYQIKLYNKYKESKWNKNPDRFTPSVKCSSINLKRFEISMKRKKLPNAFTRFNYHRIYNLESKAYMKELKMILLKNIDLMHFDPINSFDSLRSYTAYSRLTHLNEYLPYKVEHKSTYKQDRRLINSIKKLESKEQNELLKGLVSTKCDELINS